MRLVNLVGTRCTDGNLAALRTWYADHVHQLLACEGLLEARLWLREGAGQSAAKGTAMGDAPECLCLYDFESAAAFSEYESGPVRASAGADRARGWGHKGIEITMRYTLTRQYRRRGPATPPSRWHVRSLRAGSEVHRALVAGIDADVELYLSRGEPTSTLVFSAADSALPAGVSPAWSADYAPVMHWLR